MPLNILNNIYNIAISERYINYHIHLIIAICLTLTIPIATLAEDTTTETCANEAGTIITGAVTGHKYCLSNYYYDYWNAWAWCDAQGKRLFRMDDCGCDWSKDCTNGCPEVFQALLQWSWASTPSSEATNYLVISGHLKNTNTRSERFRAFCY